MKYICGSNNIVSKTAINYPDKTMFVIVFQDGCVMVIHNYDSGRLEVHYKAGTSSEVWFSHPDADYAGFQALREEIEDALNDQWKGLPEWKGVPIRNR